MENDNFNYLKEKSELIEELTERLQDLPSNQDHNDLFDDAYGEFVEEFHASYEFTEHGVELMNSDSEDMTWTIDDFVESGCKNWKEFSIYLADKLISIFRKHLEIH